MFTWFKNLFKTELKVHITEEKTTSISVDINEPAAMASIATINPMIGATAYAVMSNEEKNNERRIATEKLVAKKVAKHKSGGKRPYVKKVK